MKNIPEIENLVKLISKLPGLGPKSARRIILKLISNRNELIKPMLSSLTDLFKNVARCKSCGTLKSNLSEVYKDHGRFAKQAKDLQKWVVKNFNKEKQYKEYVDSIMSTPGLSQSTEVENMYNMINL